jgi:hypothetical protein
MTEFYLSKKGYGSLGEIRELATPDFLDLAEYESIQNDIESYLIEKR